MDGSDVSLVARARDGDADAYRELVERHAQKVFRLSYRMTGNEEDAEDVAQETFIKAYRNLARYDGRAGFGTWIYRIATNCALDLLRRRERTRTEPLADGDDAPALASADPSPERAAEGGELVRRLARAMTRLSANEKTAFVLRHQEGRSLEEIAKALGIRTGAAKTCVFRAVAKLRAALRGGEAPA
jgi:RNA polymerase sigma-70 factor (ECF subfamily)